MTDPPALADVLDHFNVQFRHTDRNQTGELRA